MYLGIDIGTSAVKAALFTRTLDPVAQASAPLVVSHPHPGWSEQAPQDWWHAVAVAVRPLTQSFGPKITSIGLSGQMHGAVLLGKGGACLHPALLWNDSRAAALCAQLERTSPDLGQIAGVRPSPGFTGPKLAWLRAEMPALCAEIAHVVMAKDYVGQKLHGQILTDPSDAAGTWLYDQAARSWSDQICGALDVPMDWLPPINPSGAQAGSLTAAAAQELGLNEGIPVATGAGDAAAGALSLGVTRAGQGLLSLGTSGQILLGADTYAAAPQSGLHSFAHAVPDRWYQMAALLNGARPMAWFAEMTGACVQTLLNDAQAAPVTGVPLCLPYLTGERTPHGDPLIRGAFYGLSNGTSRGQMMRAVIEAIAYAFGDAADALRGVMPLPTQLDVTGGGTRSDLLMQTLADVLQVPLHRRGGAAMGPALGAAMLAARAVGEDVTPPPQDKATCFDPMPSARHETRQQAFRTLYKSLAPMRDVAF